MMNWIEKERTRVRRRRGPKRAESLEKKKEPRTKQPMEVRDLAQPKGLLTLGPEAPRPTKMVLPGFFCSLAFDV